MNNPIEQVNEKIPQGAVAGLSDILLALGDELRKANHEVDSWEFQREDGQTERHPILYVQGASVELDIEATTDAHGGVKVWVLGAEAGSSVRRSGKITVQLNTGGEQFGVGM